MKQTEHYRLFYSYCCDEWTVGWRIENEKHSDLELNSMKFDKITFKHDFSEFDVVNGKVYCIKCWMGMNDDRIALYKDIPMFNEVAKIEILEDRKREFIYTPMIIPATVKTDEFNGTLIDAFNHIKKHFNIIKKTCKELNLTYKQLGELIGIGEDELKDAIKKQDVSKQITKSCELLIDNSLKRNTITTMLNVQHGFY